VADVDDLLGELLDASAARLAAYGYLLTGSQHAGEDLVQDAIVKVFVRRRRIPNARAAEGYVRATMRTLHIDAMRREGLWRKAMPGEVAVESRPDHAEAVATSDAVGRALATLSSQERVAVVLRYFDDLTVPATADAMGLADGTVKRYVSNALDKLAAVIGDEDFDVERIAVIERGE
jgi:RNA polymerase sigma factor (sigma-70 family)